MNVALDGRISRTPDSLRRYSMAEIEDALRQADGNVTLAAERLGVPAADLRRMTRFRRELVEVIDEIEEQFLDKVEASFRAQALSEDSRVSSAMIRFALNSRNAERRGWQSKSDVQVAINPQRPVVYIWNGSEIAKVGPPTIEGEKVEGDGSD